ncbi:MAG TPA: type II CAAX endopeptidase family protein [Candidatus Angelobacter sp.]|nr:type II CAAX endopeptidase family protein [Candidatus Angelobacter sp.]
MPAPPVSADGIAAPEPNLVDVLLTLLVAGGALLFCTLIGAAVLLIVRGPHAAIDKDPAGAVLLMLPIQLAAYVLTVGFMVFYTWEKYRVGFLRTVRWNMPARKFAWYALAGGSMLAFGSALADASLHRWMPKSLPIQQYFSTPASAYALAAFGILVAPLVEELFFRGFLYPALARRMGQVAGIGITAFLFAMLHAGQLALAWAPLLVLFLVGAVLTFVRARTNSVATCVLMHAGYNFTLFTMLFFSTGHFHHMEKV